MDKNRIKRLAEKAAEILYYIDQERADETYDGDRLRFVKRLVADIIAEVQDDE